ncbi:type II toxin-antitoxin system prevent-host-death family antitoxin [Rhodoplanes sp. SY1]|uniref:type II toxin-antitoxin system prevent-host-death family antitoxin n=1 Tax=Rhodoplanes sp. SY1 TaxID=3166646 RepID=UPI0038B565FB
MRHGPQTVTIHGKPTVVVVDVEEYRRLRGLEREQAPSLSDLLLALPQDGGELPRVRTRPRDVEFRCTRAISSFIPSCANPDAIPGSSRGSRASDVPTCFSA